MIVTPAKHLANRRNAKSSTGPRTGAGKQRSAQNSLRHGLAIPSWMAPNAMARHRELTLVLEANLNDIDVSAPTDHTKNSVLACSRSDDVLRHMNEPLSFYNKPAARLASAILDLDRFRVERGRVLLRLCETSDDPRHAQELNRLLRYDRRFSSQFRSAIRDFGG